MNYNDFIKTNSPLAERLRPKSLSEFIGQEHILGEGKMLKRAILADKISSLILYGPPGTGKTTLAKIIAEVTQKRFETINAVTSGIKDIKEKVQDAIQHIAMNGRQTIVFIDEIHRFNKTQQDALLPYVENGTIILIGATTENPFFEVNNALLSRSMIFELKLLEHHHLIDILQMAVKQLKHLDNQLSLRVEPDALNLIAAFSGGDARKAINALELAILTTPKLETGELVITVEDAKESVQNKASYYDKNSDHHYDTASAFIKSIRGSDPDAALLWLAKMIVSGEDPVFIARRLLISASEDIGNADPNALNVAVNCFNAVKFIGMPEGRIPLAQATVYLACAPKSNAAYLGINQAIEYLKNHNAEVPNLLKDSSYKSSKKLERGSGYQYPHDYQYGFIKQNYFPLDFEAKKFYNPKNVGYEKNIIKYLDFIEGLKNKEEI
ncbi:MAG: replication-associated recombination protein A [Tissierellales bacterium]|nr:replication-associated recombination protein A [Tissierellales bacterium]